MPTCCGLVIINTALGKEFFVCTECKQEVFKTTPVPAETPKEDPALTDHLWGFVTPNYSNSPWVQLEFNYNKESHEEKK